MTIFHFLVSNKQNINNDKKKVTITKQLKDKTSIKNLKKILGTSFLIIKSQSNISRKWAFSSLVPSHL